jgi:hypothetical protein
MKARGYQDDWMLTLGTPPQHRQKSAKWIENAWKENYIAYGRKWHQKLYFALVISWGPFGEDAISAHVVWQEIPEHLDWLLAHYKNRWGTIKPGPRERTHNNGLKYWCKNALEPGALVTFGSFQKSQKKRKKRVKMV